MPFYEQANLHAQADNWARSGVLSDLRYVPWGTAPSGRTPPSPAFGTLNHLLQCSSDQRVFVAHDSDGIRNALTSYPGVSGIQGAAAGERSGILTYNSRLRIAEIVDGTSNTLMIGERPPTSDFAYGWWFACAGHDNSETGDFVLGARESRFARFLGTYGRVPGGCPVNEKSKKSVIELGSAEIGV